jgi:hypothetical protein
MTRRLRRHYSARVLARAKRPPLLALLALALVAPAARAADPITPLSDVHRGLHCTALTVVQGTTISSFDVDVLDVVADTDGSGPSILVHVSGPAVAGTGVAEGMSGSPVYCPDAHGQVGNAGAIAATIGQYGEDVALVTPIQQMLGLPLKPPSGVRIAPKLLRAAHPLAAPLTVAGLAPSLAHLVRNEARRHGRALIVAPAGPLGTFAPQPLVPGASVSTIVSTGAVTTGAIGTVTYRDGPTVYAFGHPLDGAGRRALMLGDGYVFTVIGNPLDTQDASSYKLAAPGHVLGTLSDDALNGIVGSVGAPPATIPVTVAVRDRDRHRTLVQRTRIADETDVGNPDGSSALTQVAPIAVAQAVVSAYDGNPADETGGLCLRIKVREARAPFHFCKRYVLHGTIDSEDPPPLALAMANDVTSATSAIDGTRFAHLHVTSVTANVTIARGLRLATIVDVRGPRHARRGHTIPVALVVRVVDGPLRTIRFRVGIPSDVHKGAHALLFTGTALGSGSDGGPGALGALLALLGLGGSSGGSQSIDDVAGTIAELAGFDGVNARIGDDRFPVYRDPRMRIDGDGALFVRVVR